MYSYEGFHIIIWIKRIGVFIEPVVSRMGGPGISLTSSLQETRLQSLGHYKIRNGMRLAQ